MKEMYQMLRLHDSDHTAMRFLCGESPEEEPSVCQFEKYLHRPGLAPL